MRNKFKYFILLVAFLAIPQRANAISYNGTPNNISSLTNFNAIIQSGAVMNNPADTNNFNIIIIGMIVIILILVGAAMFASKK